MSTLKEILSNFKKELGNTFQAQKNIIDVTQKYIGLLEDAEGGSGSGGIDYSTTEKVIGKFGNDDLYQCTLVYDDTQTKGEISLNTGLSNIDTIISVEGTASYGDHSKYLPLPFADDSAQKGITNSIIKIESFNINTNKVNIFIGDDYTTNYAINKIIITIRYTKTA